MQKTYLGILLIIVAVVFFALKNAQHVFIDFWLWDVDSNLSLVIALSVTLGALSSFLFSLPYRARKNKELKEKGERIEFLDNEILHLNTKVDKARNDINKQVKPANS